LHDFLNYLLFDLFNIRYGQTSSGKTYTLSGTPNDPGIIPLAIQDIFEHIQNTPDREFLLRMSYLEIYNENISDLLKPGNDNLKIHETTSREIFVGNLTEELVGSPEEITQWLAKGEGKI
jgi:centromeric protein E